ncbi:interleukin-22 [Monodelphis domestica]|uniref:interleukin-22 n=1 Tax=Monodelphis domestica TaxID=13616 RepID=UPI0024E1CD55|nr:interleukin-22 [Monodelphis domestica]XP_056654420.1 interleukin-22 [Monodelphis domestica]
MDTKLSFFRMESLALGFLLLALLAQGIEGAVVRSPCKLPKSEFHLNEISNQIVNMSQMASLEDMDTSTRFIDSSLFQDVATVDRCYVMKLVLDFALSEGVKPYGDKFQPYTQHVFNFLTSLKSKLSKCVMKFDNIHVLEKIAAMKNKLKQIGKDGGIKIVSELDLLFLYLKKSCS